MAAADTGAGTAAPSGGHPSSRSLRQPFWATLVTVALLAAGFRRGSFAAAEEGDARAAKVEAGRGRLATRPSEIQRRGWKDILLRVKSSIGEDRIAAVAAGVAYFSLLAIFPAIAAVVSLYGLFARPDTIANHLDTLAGVIPSGGMEVIGEQIRRIADRGGATLGGTFLFGLALSLWSANAGTKALFGALNVVYDEREKRGFFKLNALTLLFTLGGIVFVLAALGVMIVLPPVLQAVGFGSDRLVTALRWPLLFVAVAAALGIVYRYGPSRERPKWRWVTWGSVLAAALWLLASMLFSWYAANFGSYNKTYGSLGAVIGFMTWMWISAMVILLGAELDAEMEHQTMRDSTTGPPRPLGQRGAHVADTVGAKQ